MIEVISLAAIAALVGIASCTLIELRRIRRRAERVEWDALRITATEDMPIYTSPGRRPDA